MKYDVLDRLGIKQAELPDRSELASVAGCVVLDIAVKILLGDVKLKPNELLRAVDIFYNVARIEAGLPTNISEHGSRDEYLARIAEIRERAQKAIAAGQ